MTKVPCTCHCHTNPGTMHFMPCCNGGFVETPDFLAEDGQNLLGMSEEDAVRVLNENRAGFRICVRNGARYIGTRDYNIQRYNLYIENNHIERVSKG